MRVMRASQKKNQKVVRHRLSDVPRDTRVSLFRIRWGVAEKAGRYSLLLPECRNTYTLPFEYNIETMFYRLEWSRPCPVVQQQDGRQEALPLLALSQHIVDGEALHEACVHRSRVEERSDGCHTR